MVTRYRDRRAAGAALARIVRARLGERLDGGVVIGLPRGGVVVANEVAALLDLPLDLLVVRKLGVPGEPELAMGAIAGAGTLVMNEDIVRLLAVPAAAIEQALRRETAEVRRREARYRGGRPPLAVRGRLALLVDDGLATGATMRAAVRAAWILGAETVVAAAPVAAPDASAALATEADDVVSAATPPDFRSVGTWYQDFDAVSDDEVCAILRRAELGDRPSVLPGGV